MKAKLPFSVVARIVVGGLLLWALAHHPYGYFVLLRWLVCAVSAFCAYLSFSLKRVPWTWLFALLALLFNPLVPIRLGHQTWTQFDVATGLLLLASIFFIKESLPKKGEPNE